METAPVDAARQDDQHRVRTSAWRQGIPWAGVAVALALFLLLGLAYSLVTPPFETPDEPFHYAFARHIAAGNGLPVQSATSTGPWHQEGSQAPLYYLLVGGLTAGIDQRDFEALSVRNQGANIGDPLFPGNKNYMRYSARAWPLVGSNLALHVGRWTSLALGMVTLLAIYAIARLLFARKGVQNEALPLLTLWVAATLPQFLFISASFSNDSLVIAASAVTVWWLLRLVARPTTAPIAAWELALLGLLLGVAALSKLQGLGLAVLTAGAGLWLVRRRGDGILLLRALFWVSLPALAVAGWWYWRNYTLYGDWFGLANLLAINGRRGDPLSWRGFVGEFRGLRYSFWGLFGWFNILLPVWIYRLLDLLSVGALLGLVGLVATRHRRPWRDVPIHMAVLAVLAFWALLSFGLWFYWTSQATGSQGRLLYPGLAAFAPLLVAGLWWWVRILPSRVQFAPWTGLIALLLGTSLYGLTVLLPYAYRQPQPIQALPADAQPVEILYGDEERLMLLGIDLPAGERFGFGQEVPVTLYLRAVEPLQDDYRLFIQLLDEEGQEIANVTSHPGWGRNPTTLWTPGSIYADAYQVRVQRPVDDRSPLLADVYVGFINPAKEAVGKLPVTARDGTGKEIVPFLGQIVVEPIRPPTVESADLRPGGAAFGQVIELAGYSLETSAGQDPSEAVPVISLAASPTLTVTLLWEAMGTPATDYTAFVHLLDGDGKRVAGYDRAPAADRFPASHWRAGDRILSTMPIDLSGAPPGDYALWVGLYESDSQGSVRLPVTAAGAFEAGDGQVRLAPITVRP